MAYFGVTVGAGFASGQEMLQYYASYGFWGIAGGAVALVVMPLAALVILQYGSHFRAQSHGKVFNSVTTAAVAKFLDYSLSVAQFCIGFVMLAGAGSNLNQQFGLSLWVGSALMVVLVAICGLLNVDKVTNLIGSITPFMILLLVVAGVYALFDPPTSLEAAHEFAITQVESPLPHWLVSTLNYVGLSMFSGISMAIIIGGTNWDPRTAGWGGFVGGVLFSVILILLTFGMLFRIDTVAGEDLPTLALITALNPQLGVFSAIVTYLMIFSTTLGVFYSLGKRMSTSRPKRFVPIFFLICIAGFTLSFFDFAFLVGNVFPILGWLGIVLILILVGTWFTRGRARIAAESRRRNRIRRLIVRKMDPEKKFTAKHWSILIKDIRASSIDPDELRRDLTEDVLSELEAEDALDASGEPIGFEDVWADEKYCPLQPGEVRIVAESEPEER